MEQTKYDVFISYSRKDYVDEQKNVISGNVVSKIKEALTEAGVTYWFDEEGIYSGQNFVEKIVSNIEASEIFIFLSTENANKSRWTCKEIASADEFGKYIIPVRIDNSPYNKKVLFRIADLNYIEYYTNPEKGIQDLISSIQTYLSLLEQDAIVQRIKTDCELLLTEEKNLESERSDLMSRINQISDEDQRKLQKEILHKSGSKQHYTALLGENSKLKQSVNILEESIKQKDKQIASLGVSPSIFSDKERKKIHFVYVAVALVLLLGGGVLLSFLLSANKKNNQTNIKLAQVQSIAAAGIVDSLLESHDTCTASLVALEAYEKSPTVEAERAFRSCLSSYFFSSCILRGHGEVVESACFSPNGKTIVSASNDNTIRIWDVATHKQIGEPLRGHSLDVLFACFSPDGKQIASASNDYTIRIWDVASHKQIGESLQGHTSYVTSVCFSPDGTRLASSSLDNTIRIWDVAKHKQIDEPLQGHTSNVTSVCFSPDGTRLASSSLDNTIRIWNVAKHTQIGEPLQGHSNNVLSANFSPNGIQIVSASADCTIRIWDVLTHKQIGEPLRGHSNSVLSANFSPNGTQIVSASCDNTICIWDSSPLQKLIDQTRERFKDRQLTHEERRKYYLE